MLGSGSKMPKNIRRYTQEHDTLFDTLIGLYGLDLVATQTGHTFLRPSDSIIKSLIAAIEGKDIDEQSAEWEKLRKPVLRLVFKGATIPGNLRPSHWYVSFGGEAYTIYEDGKTLYLHTKEVPSSDIKKGLELPIITITKNGSIILRLDKELPKGAEPKSPEDRRVKFTVPHAIPAAELEYGIYAGGGTSNVGVNRFEVFERAQDLHGKKVMEFIVGSLGQYLKENDVLAYKAVSALMTGAAEVDALLMLEPMADNTELRDMNREVGYLVNDNIITGWANWMANDMNWEDHYAAVMESLDENKGLNAMFAKKRRKKIAKSRKKIKSGKKKKKAEMNAEVWAEVDEMYKEMAANVLEGESVFAADVHRYLQERMGGNLSAYLQWHNLMFAAFDTLNANNNVELNDWLQYVNYGQPGQSFSAEIARLRAVEDHSQYSKTVSYAYKGYMPYLRCDCGDIVLEEVDGEIIMPAEFEGAYQWNEFSARRKRIKPKSKKKKPRRADDIEEPEGLVDGGAKKKKKKTTKRRKAEDGEETEEEEEGTESEGEEKKKEPNGEPTLDYDLLGTTVDDLLA